MPGAWWALDKDRVTWPLKDDDRSVNTGRWTLKVTQLKSLDQKWEKRQGIREGQMGGGDVAEKILPALHPEAPCCPSLGGKRRIPAPLPAVPGVSWEGTLLKDPASRDKVGAPRKDWGQESP